ncbi:hypothetical protein CBP36_12375 [Acidovorax carolinensis]|uniref:Uncharacterized protein n=1 Tax=Acidovorax carolinensis TaxID=553814 RepID=A0A240UDE9_9BURK|nr:hypothetical protein [Acidovorax carolinensis]ART54778.1 hypothetical protein CBP35_06550 [Acidovorax carolinensis]ART59524.1 hypothetical protein CBP36_12375 [Acidovorax carolinensis]
MHPQREQKSLSIAVSIAATTFILAVAQSSYAQTTLQLACPPDWNALTELDGPNPDRLILGLKAREWRKEDVEAVLAKTQECQRTSNLPESIKKAELTDIQTRAYPGALAAVERLSQRLQQEAQRTQPVISPAAADAPPQASAPPQVSERELAKQRLEAEFAQQNARSAEIEPQRQVGRSRNDQLWFVGIALAAILAAWYWNRFMRNRCPNCKSTDYETTNVAEVDRWRGTKAVAKTVHRRGGVRGQSYKDVSTQVGVTFVKNQYSCRCRACQTEWTFEKREEK